MRSPLGFTNLSECSLPNQVALRSANQEQSSGLCEPTGKMTGHLMEIHVVSAGFFLGCSHVHGGSGKDSRIISAVPVKKTTCEIRIPYQDFAVDASIHRTHARKRRALERQLIDGRLMRYERMSR